MADILPPLVTPVPDSPPVPAMEPLPGMCEVCQARSAITTRCAPGTPDPDLAGVDVPFDTCQVCADDYDRLAARDVTWAGTVRLGIDWVHTGFVAALFGACAGLYAWAVLGTGTI